MGLLLSLSPCLLIVAVIARWSDPFRSHTALHGTVMGIVWEGSGTWHGGKRKPQQDPSQTYSRSSDPPVPQRSPQEPKRGEFALCTLFIAVVACCTILAKGGSDKRPFLAFHSVRLPQEKRDSPSACSARSVIIWSAIVPHAKKYIAGICKFPRPPPGTLQLIQPFGKPHKKSSFTHNSTRSARLQCRS